MRRAAGEARRRVDFEPHVRWAFGELAERLGRGAVDLLRRVRGHVQLRVRPVAEVEPEAFAVGPQFTPDSGRKFTRDPFAQSKLRARDVARVERGREVLPPQPEETERGYQAEQHERRRLNR